MIKKVLHLLIWQANNYYTLEKLTASQSLNDLWNYLKLCNIVKDKVITIIPNTLNIAFIKKRGLIHFVEMGSDIPRIKT